MSKAFVSEISNIKVLSRSMTSLMRANLGFFNLFNVVYIRLIEIKLSKLNRSLETLRPPADFFCFSVINICWLIERKEKDM